MQVLKDKIVLGIDPGTQVMGFGMIQSKQSGMSVLQLGTLNLHKCATHPMKLQQIYERVVALIDEHNPDEMAIEAPFYGKNVQSMLKLGRAQGVAIAAAISRCVPITEYAPKKVKLSITGNGNASKEQVAAMLSQQLKFTYELKYFDATDALAVALCHLSQRNLAGGTSNFKNWASFIKENAPRVSGL